jgi:hypothetical protein
VLLDEAPPTPAVPPFPPWSALPPLTVLPPCAVVPPEAMVPPELWRPVLAFELQPLPSIAKQSPKAAIVHSLKRFSRLVFMMLSLGIWQSAGVEGESE